MPKDDLDALDVTLLDLLEQNPRAGVLELSRLAQVARATVTARLARLESLGVVTGYGPQVDVTAAGYPVQALATLEISQGRLADVTELLDGIPGVLAAYATTGPGDLVCRIAAESNEDLQRLLLEITSSAAIQRSTSVMILSTVVAPRTLPLLRQHQRSAPSRAPAFRQSKQPRP